MHDLPMEKGVFALDVSPFGHGFVFFVLLHVSTCLANVGSGEVIRVDYGMTLKYPCIKGLCRGRLTGRRPLIYNKKQPMDICGPLIAWSRRSDSN